MHRTEQKTDQHSAVSADLNTKDNSLKPCDQIVMPIARVSAVTRKRKQILELIHNEDITKAIITQVQEEVTIYNLKISTFRDACSEEVLGKSVAPEELESFKFWESTHIKEMKSYSCDFEDLLKQYTTETSVKSVIGQSSRSSRTSQASKSTAASRTSSMRLKLLQDKAALQAKKLTFQEKTKLETEKAALKAKQQELVMREEEERQRLIEEGLGQIEEASHADVRSRRSLRLFKKVDVLSKRMDLQNYLEQQANMHETVSESSYGDLPKEKPTSILKKNLATNKSQLFSQAASATVPQFKQPDTVVLSDVLMKQTELAFILAQNQQRSLLPNHEPEVFTGSDLTLFRPFLIEFRRLIEDRCTNDGDKYAFLLKYTSQRPHALVKSCNSDDSKVAFRKAMDQLEKHYGNQHKISCAYIAKLNEFPQIKGDDADALQELSLLLAGCLNLMSHISSLKQLESPTELQKIVLKLPYDMRRKWRSYAHKKLESKSEVFFEDLVNFITNEASIIGTPIFGDIKDKWQDDKQKPNKSTYGSKKKSFSAQTSVATENKEEGRRHLYCTCCKKTNNHTLDRCFFFGRKTSSARQEFIKQNKLCFACLGDGHVSKSCKQKLTCKKCGKHHPTWMHSSENLNEETKKVHHDSKTEIADDQDNHDEKDTNMTVRTKKSFAMKSSIPGSSTGTGNFTRIVCAAVAVKIRLPGKSRFIETYMGMDPYGTASFIDEDLLKQLGSEGREAEINLTTMANIKSRIKIKILENLEVVSLDYKERSKIPIVYAKSNWPFTLDDSPKQKDLEFCPHLSGVPFRFINERIGLLVGVNMADIVKPLDMRSGNPGSAYATLHTFGWAINGPICSVSSERLSSHHSRKECVPNIEPGQEEPTLEYQMENLCSRDFADLNDGCLQPSIADLKWKQKIQSSIKLRDDGHFEIALPFKDDHVLLPSNYAQAYRRLESLKRNLIRDQKLCEEYHQFMEKMINKKYVEVVPKDEIRKEFGKVWYIPHHGVYHKIKNKIRIVFDCSMKCRGVSLNDVLLKGPNLTNDLLGVLIRFRQDNIAFSADVESMYYQVGVTKEDSDYMRFLWYPDGKFDENPVEYRLLVHVFGSISSPSCANYALQQTASNAGMNFSREAKSTVLKNFYVDDCMKSLDSEKAAKVLLNEVIILVAEGGFNLTGCTSNPRAVLDSVDEEKLAKTLRTLDLSFEDLPYERALGVSWNVESDSLGFSFNIAEKPFTKRGVLSTVFSLYDPFGIAGPIIVPARRIFQESCNLKLSWDDPLPASLSVQWKKWLDELPLLSKFEIPRSYKHAMNKCKNLELHIFCDGSSIAYGAVAYLRMTDHDGRISCALVLAKVRLTPLRISTLKTIPRIELNAAKLAIIVFQIVRRELELCIDRSVFWSDSTTVLNYISSETGRFQRFVANRIAFIRENSAPEQWRHVPTKQNPADVLNRGSTVSKFLVDKAWSSGPEFLYQSEDAWPVLGSNLLVQEDDPELKRDLKAMSTRAEQSATFTRIFESSSSLYKTKCRLAWLLRLISRLQGNPWSSSPLTIDELRKAEVNLWLIVQRSEYQDELRIISSGSPLPRKSPLRKLCPYIDGCGLLRVGGRIGNAGANYDVTHPIILPRRSYVVKLLVSDTHHVIGHLGRESLLSTLRQKFWIIGGGTLVRSVLKACVGCRRRHEQPSKQLMAELPEDRVVGDSVAFSSVGVDYFGPYLVSRGRSTVKRYGVIFTCLASRAMHLEVAHSLTTDSFICALRRFMARRSDVQMIRSDNGTNFVGSNRELREALQSWNRVALSNWMKQRNIVWKFQPPASSHHGGVWEREIRSIRNVLNALLSQQKLTDESLSTFMCEAENVLNGRPLTPVSNDPNDLEALTPKHLLMLHSGVSFPPGIFNKEDIFAKRRWRQIQYLADQFWRRWRREYLPLLQQRQKWHVQRRSHEVGDLVLVADQMLPRGQWCLGRITEVRRDRKNLVRSAKIKISKHLSGKNLKFATTIIERPIVKLILLRSVEEL